MSESIKCINFLTNNGWKYNLTDNDYDYYDKNDCFSIGIDDQSNSMTFFDDSGDIYTCLINIYSLIGFLFHHRQIACNYTYRGF